MLRLCAASTPRGTRPTFERREKQEVSSTREDTGIGMWSTSAHNKFFKFRPRGRRDVPYSYYYLFDYLVN